VQTSGRDFEDERNDQLIQAFGNLLDGENVGLGDACCHNYIQYRTSQNIVVQNFQGINENVRK
jgi:hypothetical protein